MTLVEQIRLVKTLHSVLRRQASLPCMQISRNKSTLLEWKKHRREKSRRMADLPDVEQRYKDQYKRFDYTRTPSDSWPKIPKRPDGRDEYRKERQKANVPPLYTEDKSLNISCTRDIIEKYVPPEGDGKASLLSLERGRQSLTGTKAFTRTKLAVRTIKKYEGTFTEAEFALTAQNLYIEAHNLLQKENKEKLHEYCTELAYPLMTHGMEKKTLRWKFVESVEPPRLVQARTMEAILKKNYYAQVTVRFHTKQIMALYDQFGRLMYGSNSIVKNILEYIVFEKHISNVYGNWRIHSKIVPDWMPEGDPIVKTFILDRPEKPPEKEKEEVLSQEAKEGENEAKGKDQPIAA